MTTVEPNPPEVGTPTVLAYEDTPSDHPIEQALSLQWGPKDDREQCKDGPEKWDPIERAWLPSHCRRTSCVLCNRRLCSGLTLGIAHVQPSYMLMATGLTKDWRSTQRSITKLIKYLRRDGLNINLAWAAEINPHPVAGRPDAHVHGFGYGDSLPPGRLQERADQVGLGITTTRQVTYSGRFDYIVKASVWNQAALAAHRSANGAHIVHATRGFWTDPATEQPMSRRQLIRTAVREVSARRS